MILPLKKSPLSVNLFLAVFLCWGATAILSCTETEKKGEPPPVLRYEDFKDSVMRADTGTPEERTNLFDNAEFIPGKDSLELLLVKLDTQLHREQSLMIRLDSLQRAMNRKDPGFSNSEKEAIRANIGAVDSFLLTTDSVGEQGCRGRDCILFVEIDKSVQTLYLYILGELKDSFRVSTGKGKKYETPEMERHPSGPVLTKYTSRKFPGGNYLGLGNMPYAVFVKGGYAIHGTTPGNFSKLGTKASHGCIRIHPENAKVFNALVKTIGLNRTWVSIKEKISRDTLSAPARTGPDTSH